LTRPETMKYAHSGWLPCRNKRTLAGYSDVGTRDITSGQQLVPDSINVGLARCTVVSLLSKPHIQGSYPVKRVMNIDGKSRPEFVVVLSSAGPAFSVAGERTLGRLRSLRFGAPIELFSSPQNTACCGESSFPFRVTEAAAHTPMPKKRCVPTAALPVSAASLPHTCWQEFYVVVQDV